MIGSFVQGITLRSKDYWTSRILTTMIVAEQEAAVDIRQRMPVEQR